MTTYRKKRSKSYRSKSTRRNTKRSRIKRQSKKSLVGRVYRGGGFLDRLIRQIVRVGDSLLSKPLRSPKTPQTPETIDRIEKWFRGQINLALQQLEKSDHRDDIEYARTIRTYLSDSKGSLNKLDEKTISEINMWIRGLIETGMKRMEDREFAQDIKEYLS